MATRDNLGDIARIGLLAGVVATSVSAIGMVRAFDDRDLITGVVTLGQVLLFLPPAVAGYLAATKYEETERGPAISSGLVAGLLTALPVVGLILLTVLVPDIRTFAEGKYGLVNVTEPLIEILTLGQSTLVGSLLLIAAMGVLGAGGASIYVLPRRIEGPLLNALMWTALVSLLSDLFAGILRAFPLLGETVGRAISRFVFGTAGMTPLAAALLFIAVAALTVWWRGQGRERVQLRLQGNGEESEGRGNRVSYLVLGAVLLLLPLFLGQYLTDVLDTVGLYILMGLGLNIVVGFAGLLDLGYVAFFAIGAYVVGILTSQGDLGILNLNFWVALPIAVATSVFAGVLLGTPVLRMRGDYLAIVTLGFGEIIRILATSDLLKPFIGGAQGILQIPYPEVLWVDAGEPAITAARLAKPQHIYYLILAGCVLAAFVSWRLRDARLGRQWMAMREDEDVAEAMGIHLVKTKLLAFGIGAAFSGLAGAIFAARIGSIFPHSFSLLISINVLSLIIVGGIGSLPGVVVGALVLVGLPELLREFQDYRLLMYGALLISMMVAKPEGLWPSPVRQRELREIDEVDETFPLEAGANPFTDEPMSEQVVESPGTATK